MNPQPHGDPQFESWHADESPIGIEYSRVVIEEIRQEVAAGLQKFARGGLEVAGVLYGTREGRRIRVQSMRPIQCEHKGGPSFVLSDRDAANLAQQLRDDAQDPQLAGLLCLGWFVSHTRGEQIALTATDLEVFSEFFKDPWQVTLAVRPGRAGSMRAAFFVWENDGSVQAERSYKEFNFPDRLAGVLDAMRPRGSGGGGGESRSGFRQGAPIPVSSRVDPLPLQAPQQVPQYAVQQPMHGGGMMPTAYDSYAPAPPPLRKAWPWVAGIFALLLVLAGGGYAYYQGWFTPPSPDPVSLMAFDSGGELQIQWNASSSPVRAAAEARLDIVDSGVPQSFPLTARDLSDGRYIYVRKSGDVEVKMVLKDRDDVETQEITRFLGRPPELPVNPAQLKAEGKALELQGEVDRLTTENESLRQQIQQLQRTVRVLETRIQTQ